MGSKDKTSKPVARKPGATPSGKPGATPPRKSGAAGRRTRMFALEPRVLFDGALVADVAAEAGKVADASADASAGAAQPHAGQADAAAASASIPGSDKALSSVVAPATTNDPSARSAVDAAADPAKAVSAPVAAPADRDATKPSADADKSAADKPSDLERISDATGDAHVRHELVFVDPTVRDFQTLIDGIDNPNARIVMLDPNKDGLQQIAARAAAG